MNAREADDRLGEIFHLVERNTVMTEHLDEAFSMIHYALEKIEEKESSLPNCDENVTLSKDLMENIIRYLSLDKQCKFSPGEYCDSHVDCVDCNIAKAQSITLQRIEKEFAKWSKNGI